MKQRDKVLKIMLDSPQKKYGLQKTFNMVKTLQDMKQVQE